MLLLLFKADLTVLTVHIQDKSGSPTEKPPLLKPISDEQQPSSAHGQIERP
jgi:hypothetical protein